MEGQGIQRLNEGYSIAMDHGQQTASLESLVESGELNFPTLHPGGLELTRELGELCRIGEGARVLDVCSGTGESACFLAGHFHCHVTGVDATARMVERAADRARTRGVEAKFHTGDAHQLPFADESFDAVICECTLCFLQKEKALGEMIRVARHGGWVGIHDLCWQETAPTFLRERLRVLETEDPETLRGWQGLFSRMGLPGAMVVDRSFLIAEWTQQARAALGLAGQCRVLWHVLRRWGLAGYRRIRESERIFSSPEMGYGIIVAQKA